MEQRHWTSEWLQWAEIGPVEEVTRQHSLVNKTVVWSIRRKSPEGREPSRCSVGHPLCECPTWAALKPGCRTTSGTLYIDIVSWQGSGCSNTEILRDNVKDEGGNKKKLVRRESPERALAESGRQTSPRASSQCEDGCFLAFRWRRYSC